MLAVNFLSEKKCIYLSFVFEIVNFAKFIVID